MEAVYSSLNKLTGTFPKESRVDFTVVTSRLSLSSTLWCAYHQIDLSSFSNKANILKRTLVGFRHKVEFSSINGVSQSGVDPRACQRRERRLAVTG